MTWSQRARDLLRAVAVPALLLIAYLIVREAYDSQQDPHVPPRAPISSITPTDPMAR